MFDFVHVSDAMKNCYASKGILVDVRSGEAYRKGHLPMAIHVPLDDILEGLYRPERGKAVYLYCDTGSSSMMAARKLDAEGVEAYSVAGGIQFYKGYLEKEDKELWTMVKRDD